MESVGEEMAGWQRVILFHDSIMWLRQPKKNSESFK